MAGILRPPSNRLTRDEEASYVIHNVVNQPNYYGTTFLFDGIAISNGFDNTSFNSNMEMDIEFFDDVVIWDIGYYISNSPLIVYDNSDGVKKNKVSEISPSQYKFYKSSPNNDTWSKVGELPKGRYLICANTGQTRTSYEWFFEKTGSINKTLILQSDGYKKYTEDWQVISTTLPTQEQFLSDGMDSISPSLDRKVTALKPLPMTDKSEILSVGEEGKVFSKVLDLKKYIDIRSMKVEVK